MNVSGKIIEIYDIVHISDTFQKRELVIEYAENPQYPEFIKFEFLQNDCGKLDNFNVGDQVSVEFDLRGRKWTDRQGEVKYFNSLKGWRISPVGDTTGAGGGGNNDTLGNAADSDRRPIPEDTTDYGGDDCQSLPF